MYCISSIYFVHRCSGVDIMVIVHLKTFFKENIYDPSLHNIFIFVFYMNIINKHLIKKNNYLHSQQKYPEIGSN